MRAHQAKSGVPVDQAMDECPARPIERIIERHYMDVWRYARMLSRNGPDAEELVQDCMVRALAHPEIWDGIRDSRAYLLTILHNAYIDALAQRRRHRQLFSGEEDHAPPSSPASQITRLVLDDTARGLRRLPRDQRCTLTCVGIDGLTYQETAERLGVPLGTVMSRLARARVALRDFVEG